MGKLLTAKNKNRTTHRISIASQGAVARDVSSDYFSIMD